MAQYKILHIWVRVAYNIQTSDLYIATHIYKWVAHLPHNAVHSLLVCNTGIDMCRSDEGRGCPLIKKHVEH